jgi:hypothetical protein
MRVVYIAGRFTAGDSWQVENNVRIAENGAYLVARLGAMPLCPHTNTRHFHGTLTSEFWYEGTMELLRRCDAVYCVHGWERSSGAVREREEAERLGLPVFEHGDELDKWLHKED